MIPRLPASAPVASVRPIAVAIDRRAASQHPLTHARTRHDARFSYATLTMTPRASAEERCLYNQCPHHFLISKLLILSSSTVPLPFGVLSPLPVWTSYISMVAEKRRGVVRERRRRWEEEGRMDGRSYLALKMSRSLEALLMEQPTRDNRRIPRRTRTRPCSQQRRTRTPRTTRSCEMRNPIRGFSSLGESKIFCTHI